MSDQALEKLNPFHRNGSARHSRHPVRCNARQPMWDLPKQSSTFDGLKRARLLKSVGIKLANIAPLWPLGHIALVAPIDDATAEPAERWRLYAYSCRLTVDA